MSKQNTPTATQFKNCQSIYTLFFPADAFGSGQLPTSLEHLDNGHVGETYATLLRFYCGVFGNPNQGSEPGQLYHKNPHSGKVLSDYFVVIEPILKTLYGELNDDNSGGNNSSFSSPRSPLEFYFPECHTQKRKNLSKSKNGEIQDPDEALQLLIDFVPHTESSLNRRLRNMVDSKIPNSENYQSLKRRVVTPFSTSLYPKEKENSLKKEITILENCLDRVNNDQILSSFIEREIKGLKEQLNISRENISLDDINNQSYTRTELNGIEIVEDHSSVEDVITKKWVIDPEQVMGRNNFAGVRVFFVVQDPQFDLRKAMYKAFWSNMQKLSMLVHGIESKKKGFVNSLPTNEILQRIEKKRKSLALQAQKEKQKRIQGDAPDDVDDVGDDVDEEEREMNEKQRKETQEKWEKHEMSVFRTLCTKLVNQYYSSISQKDRHLCIVGPKQLAQLLNFIVPENEEGMKIVLDDELSHSDCVITKEKYPLFFNFPEIGWNLLNRCHISNNGKEYQCFSDGTHINPVQSNKANYVKLLDSEPWNSMSSVSFSTDVIEKNSSRMFSFPSSNSNGDDDGQNRSPLPFIFRLPLHPHIDSLFFLPENSYVDKLFKTSFRWLRNNQFVNTCLMFERILKIIERAEEKSKKERILSMSIDSFSPTSSTDEEYDDDTDGIHNETKKKRKRNIFFGGDRERREKSIKMNRSSISKVIKKSTNRRGMTKRYNSSSSALRKSVDNSSQTNLSSMSNTRKFNGSDNFVIRGEEIQKNTLKRGELSRSKTSRRRNNHGNWRRKNDGVTTNGSDFSGDISDNQVRFTFIRDVTIEESHRKRNVSNNDNPNNNNYRDNRNVRDVVSSHIPTERENAKFFDNDQELNELVIGSNTKIIYVDGVAIICSDSDTKKIKEHIDNLPLEGGRYNIQNIRSLLEGSRERLDMITLKAKSNGLEDFLHILHEEYRKLALYIWMKYFKNDESCCIYNRALFEWMNKKSFSNQMFQPIDIIDPKMDILSNYWCGKTLELNRVFGIYNQFDSLYTSHTVKYTGLTSPLSDDKNGLGTGKYPLLNVGPTGCGKSYPGLIEMHHYGIPRTIDEGGSESTGNKFYDHFIKITYYDEAPAFILGPKHGQRFDNETKSSMQHKTEMTELFSKQKIVHDTTIRVNNNGPLKKYKREIQAQKTAMINANYVTRNDPALLNRFIVLMPPTTKHALYGKQDLNQKIISGIESGELVVERKRCSEFNQKIEFVVSIVIQMCTSGVIKQPNISYGTKKIRSTLKYLKNTFSSITDNERDLNKMDKELYIQTIIDAVVLCFFSPTSSHFRTTMDGNIVSEPFTYELIMKSIPPYLFCRKHTVIRVLTNFINRKISPNSWDFMIDFCQKMANYELPIPQRMSRLIQKKIDSSLNNHGSGGKKDDKTDCFYKTLYCQKLMSKYTKSSSYWSPKEIDFIKELMDSDCSGGEEEHEEEEEEIYSSTKSSNLNTLDRKTEKTIAKKIESYTTVDSGDYFRSNINYRIPLQKSPDSGTFVEKPDPCTYQVYQTSGVRRIDPNVVVITGSSESEVFEKYLKIMNPSLKNCIDKEVMIRTLLNLSEVMEIKYVPLPLVIDPNWIKEMEQSGRKVDLRRIRPYKVEDIERYKKSIDPKYPNTWTLPISSKIVEIVQKKSYNSQRRNFQHGNNGSKNKTTQQNSNEYTLKINSHFLALDPKTIFHAVIKNVMNDSSIEREYVSKIAIVGSPVYGFPHLYKTFNLNHSNSKDINNKKPKCDDDDDDDDEKEFDEEEKAAMKYIRELYRNDKQKDSSEYLTRNIQRELLDNILEMYPMTNDSSANGERKGKSFSPSTSDDEEMILFDEDEEDKARQKEEDIQKYLDEFPSYPQQQIIDETIEWVNKTQKDNDFVFPLDEVYDDPEKQKQNNQLLREKTMRDRFGTIYDKQKQSIERENRQLNRGNTNSFSLPNDDDDDDDDYDNHQGGGNEFINISETSDSSGNLSDDFLEDQRQNSSLSSSKKKKKKKKKVIDNNSSTNKRQTTSKRNHPQTIQPPKKKKKTVNNTNHSQTREDNDSQTTKKRKQKKVGYSLY